RTLEDDDVAVYTKAYASATTMTGASRLEGIVNHGTSGAPVGGAIVYVIDEASEDTTACDFTLDDGTFRFVGLPDGDYFVTIHPLDGTSPIDFLTAGNINAYLVEHVDVNFAAESFDALESNDDNPADRTAVSVSDGNVTTVAIVTNIDNDPPTVISASPSNGTMGAPIDGAYLVGFSERIDDTTIGGAFTFRDAMDVGVAGNIVVLHDDSMIVFTPSAPLAFSTPYTLRLNTTLTDLTGNGLASDFELAIVTENEPPISITSLAPNKGVVGTTIVVNGRGFDPAATVTFNGQPAAVLRNSPSSLLVRVPDAATTGAVVVTNPGPEVSNDPVFTVLSDAEVARGYESGSVPLAGTPHALALGPDGVYAYVAAEGGVETIEVGPVQTLAHAIIQEPGTFCDVATTPDGKRVYALNETTDEIVEIMSDPTAGPLEFHTIIASRPLGATPRSIVVDPFGYRAYVSTDAASIQVWNIRLGTPNYQQQVGVLESPEGISLAGEMAIPPAGDQLLALGASGEVFFYELATGTLTDRVSVNPDPRHLVIDPQGQRAYVADGSGDLAVLSIGVSGPFFVQDIVTGGSLRGLDTTPAGLYVYATDRDLDNLKIVDLDETHSTFRSVVETPPQVSNPVDIALSSDGVYAFSIMQGDGATAPRMAVTTIALGPTILSMYPTAGQPGTQVVFTFVGLGEDVTTLDIDFNGVLSTATLLGLSRAVVTVPAGVTTGPTKAIAHQIVGPDQASNSVQFTALQPSSENNLRLAGALPSNPAIATCDYYTPALAFSPNGEYLYTGCGGTNEVRVHDLRETSPNFHQTIGAFGTTAGLGEPVLDISITADGKVAFVGGGQQDGAAPRRVQTFYADPNDPRFLTRGPEVPGNDFLTPRVSTSPNNRTIIVYADEGPLGKILVLDGPQVSNGSPPIIADTTGAGGTVMDIVHHPTSRAAYLGLDTGIIRIFDTDPNSPAYGLGVATIPTGLTEIWSLAISGDGRTLYAYGYFYTDLFQYQLVSFDVTNPVSAGPPTNCYLNLETEVVQPPAYRLAPQGDFGIRTIEGFGFLRHNLPCESDSFPALAGNTQAMEFAFHPHGSRVYAADQPMTTIAVYDFVPAQLTVIASGNNQQGVVDETLPAPLRVQVTSSVPGADLSGVTISYRVTSGGGSIVTSGGPVTNVIVTTDEDGFAQVSWHLGASLGAQSVNVQGPGLTGAMLVFQANANADPSTLPLSLGQIVPLHGSTDISPTTVLLATFSRAVDPATITDSSFFLREGPTGPTIAATFGFTDSNRRVSVTPSAALDVATVYEILLTDAIQASGGGGALTNPSTSEFTTAAAQPLSLASVWPPSAIAGVAVTLSGQGFDPVFSANTVLFNGVAATPFEGTSDFLRVHVPATAATGTIRVVAGAATSNAVDFTVLVPSTSTIDDVIATVGAGSGTKSVVISADGTLCYAVGTDGDVVIPVGIEDAFTYPSIPVGDQPVAIVLHPGGSFGYVANFNSGTVSIIDVDPDSPDFNTVVGTIAVGINPLDVAISPDGDRLAVANAGSSDVSLVDTDETSEAYNEVVATVGAGSGTKSVVISADGTLYVGTGAGVLVIDESNSVVATVSAGSGVKSVVISADGTLLFALTSNDEVVVVDIQDESPSENQVVATVGAGSGSKSIVISADGTLLYIVQESTDEVLIVAIEVIPGVGATDPDGANSFTVDWHIVGTLETGDGPADIAVDPSGSGRVAVANAGDGTVTFYGRPFEAIAAVFKLVPGVIIPKLPGFYVLGVIQLPAPLSVHDIDIASVRVFDTVQVATGKYYIADVTHDGVDDLSVLFCRDEFLAAMPENGEHVDVVCTGLVAGEEFEGTDDILVLRPTILTPVENAVLQGGQPFEITWTTPLDVLPCDKVKIEWRQNGDDADDIDCDFHDHDGGIGVSEDMDELQRLNESAEVSDPDWILIANHVNNDGDYVWNVPAGYYPNARLRITLLWLGFKVGSSEVPFSIDMPLPTRMQSFDVTLEDGNAVLRWETSLEVGMQGFDVVRSDAEQGRYDVITKEMVLSSGSTSGGSYEYRDESIAANRTYWYKLREVADD
ncbi:MAG: beta-propeller fold lactonase family protein, partial [Candidatus Latescibacteria bacterium]|nr:beta-propeller fold lactonase family protein [Candidatus Latescibacterota bacterium]